MPTFPALVLGFLLSLLGFATPARAADPGTKEPGDSTPVVFNVTIDPSARKDAASGRLIVLLKRTDAKLPPGIEPIEGPYWDAPQPLFGRDVKDLAPGAVIKVDDQSDAFPVKPSQLEPGAYYAQARLDTVRESSSWKNQDGNLFSEPVLFGIEKGKPVEVALTLKQVTKRRPMPAHPRVEIVEIKSELLSKFFGKETKIRAAVVRPLNEQKDRKYAAIYNVPGFGGGVEGAIAMARQGDNPIDGTATSILQRNCFQISLDPESPNGHTLFADSANNGPRGEALIKELIPAIEAKFPLDPRPAARLLRGHSSGGWSTLWLAVNYPDTFGATWSSSPDPVDFRKLQSVNIYQDQNMYHADGSDHEWCSYRKGGAEKMSIRQETGSEDILGPDNTSAQQWDSWFATFGPKNTAGHPAALFDPKTGQIDHAIAALYRKYDIAELFRNNPDKIGSIFRRSIRLYVGDQDNFYLNEAVKLFKDDLDRLYPEDKVPQPERFGTIKMIPGVDHGSIFGTQDLRAIPQDMVEHLRRNELIK